MVIFFSVESFYRYFLPTCS